MKLGVNKRVAYEGATVRVSPGEHLSSKALKSIVGQALRAGMRGCEVETTVDAGLAQRHGSVVVRLEHVASPLRPKTTCRTPCGIRRSAVVVADLFVADFRCRTSTCTTYCRQTRGARLCRGAMYSLASCRPFKSPVYFPLTKQQHTACMLSTHCGLLQVFDNYYSIQPRY